MMFLIPFHATCKSHLSLEVTSAAVPQFEDK